MTNRIRHETVVFAHPFHLRGWPAPQPAGTYVLETEEEEIQGISFSAYRRVSTTITREASRGGHCRQVIPVDPLDLDAARLADQAGREAAP
jgi:hypothetical protein